LEGSISFSANGSQLLFPPPDGVSDDVALTAWDLKFGSIAGPAPGEISGANRAQNFSYSSERRFPLVFAGVRGGNEDPTYGSAEDTAAWEKSVVPARVLRASDGARVAKFTSTTGDIWHAAWDPKGRYVAFVDTNHALFLWRPLALRLSYEKIELPSVSLTLSVSPDGDHLAVATHSGVTVFSISG
jgi:WD40 repeat protein